MRGDGVLAQLRFPFPVKNGLQEKKVKKSNLSPFRRFYMFEKIIGNQIKITGMTP